MRFGLVVAPGPLDELAGQAVAAEAAGFDLVWLRGFPSPAVAAAALAPRTGTIRVGISLVAGVNPVYLAEEAIVADLCLGGRSVLALESDDAGLLAETTDVVLAALAARPFRHEGERWRIPANLPENVVNREERVRVTPASAQLELPVWLAGAAAVPVAIERCLTFVGTAGQSGPVLAHAWTAAQARLGPAVARLRRVAERDVPLRADRTLDAAALVERLHTEQREWGLDVVLLRLPAGPIEWRRGVLGELAREVVPRVQLDRLPPGLDGYWTQRQEALR